MINLDINQYERVFVCADVHNDYSSLIRGVNALNIGENDLLIVNGDLIDRGCFPDRCLRFCLDDWKESEQNQCKIIYLMGNHEQMITEYIEENYCDDVKFKMPYNYNTIEILKHMSGGATVTMISLNYLED